MKFKTYFTDALQQHYLADSSQLIAQVDARFLTIEDDIVFAKKSPNPMDKRLIFIGYFLAFIQTLEAYGQNYDQIRKISLEVAHEYVRPKTKIQSWLKKLPIKFIGFWFVKSLLKRFNNQLQKRGHANGFVAEIITDKSQTLGTGYGINIIECGVCKLFNHHQASKYTSILCDVDKITTEFAGLELLISGTISRGAPICDFRYKLK